MKNLASFYHSRLALIDLTADTAQAAPLPHEILEKGLGGGALATALAEIYPDALFLCAGPLSGSYAPASGLLTFSFPHSEKGGLIHAAIPLGHGAWLRQSGFDAMVITGRGESARIIRCAKGACLLENAPAARPRSGRGGLRAALLRGSQDGRAALILADALNRELPVAGGAEYGSLPAGTLAGPALRERRLLAVCLEGGASLPPVPVALDNALRKACTQSSPPGSAAAFLREAGMDPSPRHGFRLKGAACFHCPSPCLAWLESSGNMHLLMADHGAFASAVDACGKNAPAMIAACDRAGLDPRTAGSLLEHAAVEEFALILETAMENGAGSGLRHPAERLNEAERAGLILGLCPRLIRRTPALSRDMLDSFAGGDMAALLVQSESLLGQEVFL